MRSVVDLPAPFGPNNPVICPSRAEKFTPRTAAIFPKDLKRSACFEHQGAGPASVMKNGIGLSFSVQRVSRPFAVPAVDEIPR